MKLDDQICYCFHVSKRKIVNYVRIHQPVVASQISECSGAGTGCGWCIPFLKKIFNEAKDRTISNDSEVTSEELSAEEYAALREEYIHEGHGTPPVA